MRHNAKRPQRGNRPQNKKGGNNKTKVYDSNGPDVRVRGTAYQITEKYEALAKDAERSGNVVLAENYLQHLEHYQRIINSFEDDTVSNNQALKVNQNYNGASIEAESDQIDDLTLPASIVGNKDVERETVTA